MQVAPKMMAKFEQCKSADEIMNLAKQEKISLTMEQAQKVFDFLRSEDISDEMMEKIAGGGMINDFIKLIQSLR